MRIFRRCTAIGVLIAIAVGVSLVSRQYCRDIDTARARVVSGSHVLSTPCGPIEYAEAGQGPAILAIHGAGGGFDQSLALLAPLAAQGYRVIATSRFGYLRTPAPAHPSIALQAESHACLLDALGISRAVVIGASAGAPSALEFALRYSDRCMALVLLVPGWYPEAGSTRMGPLEAFMTERLLRSDFAFWAFTRTLPTMAKRLVLGTPSGVIQSASPGEQARLAGILRAISPVSQRQVGLSLERQLTREALSQPLASLNVPTLVISAEDDLYGTYANARFIAGHAPDCKLIVYQSGGHMLVGHDDEALDEVVAFLRAHEV
jgi:pimeloyl-ACP methyl ester carboxylesterase